MTLDARFEIFLVAAPGLEQVLCAEATSLGFAGAQAVTGGVTFQGSWPDVWRANLEIRGTGKVLARIGAFRALHLAQLDKRSRQFPWRSFLRPEVPVRIDVTCKRSRIFHAGAAAERIATALREEVGVPTDPQATICIKARIEDDLCTFSLDTSGELLHKRGHKEAIGKAPMRETMAALFLRQCGYTGSEPVVDPMCGSGTFVIEAAEIAAGLKPGRSRHFAFEHLAGFDAAAWARLQERAPATLPVAKCFGSDRDAGAITMCIANAERAGVAAGTEFKVHTISDLKPPEGPPGLVIVNPPYGARIGNKKPLTGLYSALGKVLLGQFSGWRVGIITTDANLARMTGLPFLPTPRSVLHGGLRVELFQTKPLPRP